MGKQRLRDGFFANMATNSSPPRTHLALLPPSVIVYFPSPWVSAGSWLSPWLEYTGGDTGLILAHVLRQLAMCVVVLLEASCHGKKSNCPVERERPHRKRGQFLWEAMKKEWPSQAPSDSSHPSWGARHLSEALLVTWTQAKLVDECSHVSDPSGHHVLYKNWPIWPTELKWIIKWLVSSH